MPAAEIAENHRKISSAFARVLGCSTSVIKRIEGGDKFKLNKQLFPKSAHSALALVKHFGVFCTPMLMPCDNL
jgi:hypothetical protein